MAAMPRETTESNSAAAIPAYADVVPIGRTALRMPWTYLPPVVRQWRWASDALRGVRTAPHGRQMHVQQVVTPVDVLAIEVKCDAVRLRERRVQALRRVVEKGHLGGHIRPEQVEKAAAGLQPASLCIQRISPASSGRRSVRHASERRVGQVCRPFGEVQPSLDCRHTGKAPVRQAWLRRTMILDRMFADVANFVLDQVRDNSWLRRSPLITW